MYAYSDCRNRRPKRFPLFDSLAFPGDRVPTLRDSFPIASESRLSTDMWESPLSDDLGSSAGDDGLRRPTGLSSVRDLVGGGNGNYIDLCGSPRARQSLAAYRPDYRGVPTFCRLLVSRSFHKRTRRGERPCKRERS